MVPGGGGSGGCRGGAVGVQGKGGGGSWVVGWCGVVEGLGVVG